MTSRSSSRAAPYAAHVFSLISFLFIFYFVSSHRLTSQIKEGTVLALVIATGMNSVYGRVKALVQKERSNTPLQDKLEELADFIGWLGVGAAILTWIALVAKVTVLSYSLNLFFCLLFFPVFCFVFDHGSHFSHFQWAIYRFVTTDLGWEWSQANVLVEFIITAITIVAMAVPEGKAE
jgi:magnesium-transporting ATPase (P-type)